MRPGFCNTYFNPILYVDRVLEYFPGMAIINQGMISARHVLQFTDVVHLPVPHSKKQILNAQGKGKSDPASPVPTCLEHKED